MKIYFGTKTWIWLLVCAQILLLASPSRAEDETQKLVRLLPALTIYAEEGFKARVIVPPGVLYDPLAMIVHDNEVWIADDGGGEYEEFGGQIVAVKLDGAASPLHGVGKIHPVTGIDVAPSSFGNFAGQIFVLARARAAYEAAFTNSVVDRIDPLDGNKVSQFCVLNPVGTLKGGIPPVGVKATGGVSAQGVEAWFGPENSAFAGKFYPMSFYNHTIYQATPDGVCKPFVNLEKYGPPCGLTFTPDGRWMIVSVGPGGSGGESGAIIRVASSGEVDEKPLVKGLVQPYGMAYAPDGFGKYGGDLFFADSGDFQMMLPIGQRLKTDGKVYRLTRDGQLKLLASGLVNPTGVRFVNNRLWVNDINGDYILGKRELPDGFIVEIQAE